MNALKLALVSSLVVSTALLASCGKDESTTTAKTDTTQSTWLLAQAPADAMSVTEIKADAKEGDTVVIRGRIGGRAEPMSADSPVFTIIDLALPYCGQHHPENCPRPWDYCCEPSDTITANAATIQIVGDESGNVALMPTAAGLKPLDEIIVIGTVGPRPSSDVLTVRATGVHRVASVE